MTVNQDTTYNILRLIGGRFHALEEVVIVSSFILVYALVIFFVIYLLRCRYPRAFSGINPAIVSPLGGIFGLTVAFLTSDVWNNNALALHAVNDEARALSQVWVVSSRLDPPLRDQIRAHVITYERIVLDEEWPLLPTIRDPDNPVSRKARAELYAIMALVADGGGASGQERVAANVFTLTVEAFRNRTQRIAIAIDYDEYAKLYLALGLGFMMILGVALIHVEDRRVLFGIVMGASVVTILVIGTAIANDEPFERGWSGINLARFFDITGEMKDFTPPLLPSPSPAP